jgi:hypothetical protein
MKRLPEPGFELTLPDGSDDASTYCYVLPEEGRFKPSVVVKCAPVRPTTVLKDYVRAQVTKMVDTLENFQFVVGQTALSDDPVATIGYEWGSDPRRFRQLQRYVRTKDRVFCITATHLAELFHTAELKLQKALDSFKPNK